MSYQSKCITNLISTLDNLKSMDGFPGRAKIMRKVKRDIVFLGRFKVEDGICRLISKEVEKIMKSWID